jgi:hypothetical protein
VLAIETQGANETYGRKSSLVELLVELAQVE